MRLLSPKLMLSAAGIATLFIFLSLAQEINRRVQIRQEIVQLENEVRRLEKNVIEMENINQYFKTDAFAERMAREKLNYQAVGEKVVLIPDEPITEPVTVGKAASRAKSIPRLWWDTFFTND